MKINAKKILSCLMAVAIFITALSMVVFADETAAPTGDGAAQAKAPSMWLIIIIYVAFFGIVGYFLIFRPNKKRKKQEEELRGSIILGDEVTTIGGIVGRVVNIKDDNITIESSLDKTLMEFKNWAVREVKKPISDDEPAPEERKDVPVIDEMEEKKTKKDKKDKK